MGLRIATHALAVACLAGTSLAFVPHSVRSATPKTARSFGVDPSVFQDLPQHIQNLPDAFGSMTLSDAAEALADAASSAAPAVEEVVKKDAGWFGFLTVPISVLLQGVHSTLVGAGLSANSWGISIIMLTVLIKVVTFPLTKTQLESTNKMQALQPSIKEVQAKYQSNPEVMNQKIAELYQTNDVNPLAGCLPSLVQIPVFIGLYRSVLDLAQENKLDEPFLFLPNLEGPTYGADPAHGSDWLFQGWVDGAPQLGWTDTGAFLALPIFLVISQVISMQLMQPKNADPSTNNVVLKLLPLMIGWFSLNVPAALTIYWVVNNIVTTATTLAIRNSMDMTPVTATGSSASATSDTIFAPSPPKPEGFGTPQNSEPPVIDSSGVKPITGDVGDAVEEEDDEVDAGVGMSSDGGTKKKRGKKRSKKKKN